MAITGLPPGKVAGLESIDLASLATSPVAAGHAIGTSPSKLMVEAISRLTRDAQVAAEATRMGNPQMTGALARLARETQVATGAARTGNPQMLDALDAARRAQESWGSTSTLVELSRRIREQQKAVDALRPGIYEALERTTIKPPTLPTPRFVENPIHETNRRLKLIQGRFDRMEALGVEAAGIATGLQGSAAEFLGKFEKAAADNDRTTKRVIWISAAAVVIALMMPVIQILHMELWRAPADAAAAQVVISELRGELTELKATQRQMGEKLTEELTKSNADLIRKLEEIKQSLIRQAPAD